MINNSQYMKIIQYLSILGGLEPPGSYAYDKDAFKVYLCQTVNKFVEQNKSHF